MADVTIIADGYFTIDDAVSSSGVAYLTGVPDGATVSLGVATASQVVRIAESEINKPTVVVHGAGAVLTAIVKGAGASTDLTLQFNPI